MDCPDHLTKYQTHLITEIKGVQDIDILYITSIHYILEPVMVVVHYIFLEKFCIGSEYICFLGSLRYYFFPL